MHRAKDARVSYLGLPVRQLRCLANYYRRDTRNFVDYVTRLITVYLRPRFLCSYARYCSAGSSLASSRVAKAISISPNRIVESDASSRSTIRDSIRGIKQKEKPHTWPRHESFANPFASLRKRPVCIDGVDVDRRATPTTSSSSNEFARQYFWYAIMVVRETRETAGRGKHKRVRIMRARPTFPLSFKRWRMMRIVMRLPLAAWQLAEKLYKNCGRSSQDVSNYSSLKSLSPRGWKLSSILWTNGKTVPIIRQLRPENHIRHRQ